MSKKVAVTGASGYIGSYCVIALLEAGFDVVAVVRDTSNETKTQFLIAAASTIGKADNLSFASGDLFKSGSYDEAFASCWGVLHTAAVLPGGGGFFADQYEAIVKPAIEGTKNVLDSIKKNSETIQRFINISSVAAVASPSDMTRVFTEDDWNTSSTVENGEAYQYAKTEAEKLVYADEDLKQCVGTIASLNPGIVIGPCLSQSQAESKGSHAMVTRVLKGYPMLDIPLCFVDVRDVAKAAVLAFTQDEKVVTGQRFILNHNVIYWAEFENTVKKGYPPAKGRNKIGSQALTSVTNGTAWLVKTFPVFGKVKILSDLSSFAAEGSYDFDNTKSKTVLGLGEYRDFDETCKDAAESIAELIGFEKK